MTHKGAKASSSAEVKDGRVKYPALPNGEAVTITPER
jgi:hypothetical protein